MTSTCGRRALGPQGVALLDAEPVLLVDDDQAEVGEGDALRRAARACRRRCRPRRLAASASAARRAAAPCEPVSSATRVATSGDAELAGRSRADRAARPASARAAAPAPRSGRAARPARRCRRPASIARSATTVLPEPTSPCSSRCIGAAAARSAASTSPTSGWPAVSANGSAASKAASSPPGRPGRGIPGSARVAARRWASTTCRTKASSQVSRVRARATSSRRNGGCTSRSACSSATSRCRRAQVVGQRVGAEVDHRRGPRAPPARSRGYGTLAAAG